MSLSYAILATLTDQACSGYELAKRFDGSVGHFWSASHQQIYRELNRLEERQWITGEVIPQTGRPDKKCYHLTEMGKAEMAKWIAQPSKSSRTKEEILVKLFAGDLVEPEVLLAELCRYQQEHEQQLQIYQQIEQQHFAEPEQLSWGAKCQYLTLRQGMRYEVDVISWCEEALALLKS
ncbi:PadR family transcriptional regulator [Acaryochloris sp. IP29b_bin.148]|uniref:PadR family transcriptional regulator n=1 Tax=Acaryochloris sp. IP29b_bin.148 TaxID=2969218 RepID=UPI0026273FD6|nr:PadR family transcriptional regulator [Acaryochloris sp. IP29b_bin.148]